MLKLNLNVVREKDQKIIEAKGPDYEETIENAGYNY
jgi:hypothetical protein